MDISAIMASLQAVLLQTMTQLQQYLCREQDLAAAAVLLILGSITGVILYHLVVVNYKNHRVKRTFQSGRIAETAAVKFLRSNGYKILASQLREDVIIYVDGAAEKSIVRADYLVRRGWKTYVVEVKSGQQGNAKLPAIRRQLLEYHMVYQPDGILLLDMEHKNLQEIRFAYAGDNRHSARQGAATLVKLIAALLLIAVVVLLLQGTIGWEKMLYVRT